MLDVYFSVSLVFLLIIIVVLENTCWMVYSNDSLDFLVSIVLEWHFSPSSLVFFCSPPNKHKLSSRFGCSHLHPIRQLTHTRCSDGAPDPDGELKKEVRIQIRHYRNIYLNRPDTWRKYRSCGFPPPWPFLYVFYTTVSFHSLSTSHTVSSPFPLPFSSVIWLRDTCWVWLIGVFNDTQTFSVPTSSCKVLSSDWPGSSYSR